MEMVTKKRVGRVVFGNEVRDIMLDSKKEYDFDFSRYKSITHPPFGKCHGEERIVCVNGPNPILFGSFPPSDREETAFWEKAVGFETGNRAGDDKMRYSFVSREFDVLKGAAPVFVHPELESIVKQVGVSSIAVFCQAQSFGLTTTGETVSMELTRMERKQGRSAAFENPVLVGGRPYLLEVKGVSLSDGPINLKHPFDENNECLGGLTKTRMMHSVDMIKKLNEAGLTSKLLIAAYEVPLKQFNGQSLALYVRAVPSSPPLSNYVTMLPHVADALGMERSDLAEYIIDSVARDMAIVWKAGLTHGWIHEQNIRIGGVTDFTGASYVLKSGFNGVATDAEMIVATSQKILRRLVGPYPIEIPKGLYKTDPEEAERLEDRADERGYEDQAKIFCRAREVISNRLNKDLGLNIPSVVGTTTLAAHIYAMQKDLGLTDPKEVLRVDFLNGYKKRKPNYNPMDLKGLLAPIKK